MVEEAPREGNAGFAAASPPAEGALKREEPACGVWPPGAAPKSGLGALLAVAAWLVDSAGLFAPPKRPPAPPVAGVVDWGAPKRGFEAPDEAPEPNRPPEGCG